MKKIVFTLCLALNFINAYSQNLVVNSVNYTFSPDEEFTDSLSHLKRLTVSVNINDADLLGQIIIDLIENESQNPMVRIKKNLQDLMNENRISNNTIVFPIGTFDSNKTYSLKVMIKNFQLLNLPQSELIITPEN
jgi:hypothetical protein